MDGKTLIFQMLVVSVNGGKKEITKLATPEWRNQYYTFLLSAHTIKKKNYSLKIGAWQKFCVGLFLQIRAILYEKLFVEFSEMWDP